jgi:hypothetical protein
MARDGQKGPSSNQHVPIFAAFLGATRPPRYPPPCVVSCARRRPSVGSQGGASSYSVIILANLGVHGFVTSAVNPNVSQRAQQKEMSIKFPRRMTAGRVESDVMPPKWDDFGPSTWGFCTKWNGVFRMPKGHPGHHDEWPLIGLIVKWTSG